MRGPLRVLLAEDDDVLREILQEGLQADGFEVVVAEDGARALELFRSGGPYDALLLDEEMPVLTGRQLLGKIRAQGEAVAAILISGNLELSGEERAALGVGPVLRKPVSLDELTREIRRAIAAPSS
jgi:CheY-like chemotaxis protein